VVLLALTVVLEQEQQAPAPVLKKADDFRIDPDGPAAAGHRAYRSEAAPEASVTREIPADQTPADKAGGEARLNPRLLESASMRATAAQDSAGIASGPGKATDKIPAADAWIDQLLQLKKTHQDERLAEELTRFRAVYPDYPLPPELDD
jgi:hypothetical protein